MDRRTAANVARYRWHARAAGAVFWLPTIILYFIDEVGLARTLQMQAVYYASVVLFEVPSGWFSDRVGRVTILRVTSIAWVTAFLCFLIGGVGPIVAGQMLLAVGYASLSGTDVTFLFDTLDAAGLAHRFEAEEVRAREGRSTDRHHGAGRRRPRHAGPPLALPCGVDGRRGAVRHHLEDG